MKNTARLISWILMIMMVVSLIPVSISAADECDHAEYGIVSVLKEANCAEGIRGIGKFECVSCGHTWYAQYDGHNMVETTIDATCDSPALVGEQCTICGAVGEATEVEGSTPRDHGWRTLYDHEDTVDATCEEGGVRVRECRYCGEIKLEEREPYGHWWRSTNDKVVDADCENPSGIKQTCSDCGKSQIVPVEGVPSEPAKGHTYEAVEDVAPTCKEPGLTGKKVCSVCGKVDKDNPGTEVPADASAHKAELVSTLKAATCTVNGIGKYACEYCGANIGYKVIPASHNFELLVGAGVDATCGEDGEAVYFCTGCGEEEIKVIEATGEHDMVETTIDADCNNPAMVGEQCTVCGAVGEATVVEDSEALGHDMVVDEENEDYVPATCTEGGLDTLKCSRCDYAETKETEALGHEWVDGYVVEADCENAAGVEQFCAECGEIQVVPFEGELAEPAKGHTPEAVEDKAPTCETPGVTGRTRCSVCRKVVDRGTEVPVDANAHEFYNWPDSYAKEPTCDTNGVGKFECRYCTYYMFKVVPPEHTYEFDWDTYVPATCGKDGTMQGLCQVCGELGTVVWEYATGKHEMVADTLIDATCTEPARVGEICIVCGEKGEVNIIEGEDNKALGHDMVLDDSNEDYKAATCTEGGLDTLKCSRCDYTETKETEALGHEWVDGYVVEADCENAAGVEQFCAECGEIQVVPFEGELAEPAKGHTPEAVEDKAPTCSEAGLTGVTVCSVCGEVIDEGTEVPADASAHKAVLVSSLKDATCTANGIGKYACEYCGANMGYKVIPASHNFELLVGAGVDATCGEDGEAVYFCTGCGEEEIKVIEATGEHDMVETTIDADCNNPAMVGEQCTVCGAVGEATVVEDSEALGHDMVVDEENEDYVPATCTEGGLDTLKCSRCDYAETKETEALGHEWIDLGVVEADCENAAGVEQFCVKCEEIQVVPFEGELAEEAKGHTPEAVEDKAPTCKTPGVTGQTKCSVCGEVVDEGTEVPVDANAHKAVLVDVLKPATCTVNGIGKYACEYCDANMGYKAFLADHEWGEEEFDEETLVIYCGCLNCDEIYIVEDLNEHVHAYEAVITEPTCTTAGYTTYTCECGDTYTADEVAAIEHTYEAVVTEPTCTTAGYTTYTCVCGDTYTADEVAVGEHTWDEGVITKKPTETTTGIRTYTCGICGVTKTENIAKLSHSHNYKAVMTGGSKISYVCSCGDTLR